MSYRCSYLIIILVLATALSAQDSLDLGDIFIYGESELLPDYRRYDDDLQNHWIIYEKERFDHEPQVYLSSPNKMIEEEYDESNLSAMLMIGHPVYVHAKLASYSQDKPWLNLNLNYNHDQPTTSWRSNTYSAFWQNKFADHRFTLDLRGGLFTVKEPYLETDIREIGLSYQTPKISLNDDVSITKLQLRGSLFTGTQELEPSWDKIDKEEFHYGLKTSWLANKLDGELIYLHGGYGHAGAKSINLALNPYLDQIGVWLAADKDDIYASLNLYKEVELTNSMKLRIENKPVLVERNRINDFKENQFQWIREDYRIGKAPLNSTVALLHNSFVPLTLSYNVRWEKDKDYLIRDALYTDNSDNIYHQVYYKIFTDLLKQTVSLKAAYSWDNLFWEIGVAYHIYDDEIPFLPGNTINTSITYEKGSLKTVLVANYTAGKINDKYRQQDRDMDNALLFDLYGSYALGERVSAFAEIQNLLDEDYYRYLGRDFPKEKRRFVLGGQYRF
jgi:outer membrane receptor protein involved in Fe transport